MDRSYHYPGQPAGLRVGCPGDTSVEDYEAAVAWELERQQDVRMSRPEIPAVTSDVGHAALNIVPPDAPEPASPPSGPGNV